MAKQLKLAEITCVSASVSLIKDLVVPWWSFDIYS